MNSQEADGPAAYAVHRLTSWVGEWPFAAFLLFTIVFSEIVLVTLMAWPADLGTFGRFADEFRTWCLGQDRSTGHLQWAYVGMYILNPLAVGAVIWAVWSRPLRVAFAGGPRAFFAPAFAAFLLILASTAALYAWQEPVRPADYAFPATELRTATPAPQLALVDQEGLPFDLSAWRGRPILITSVYSSCGTACPKILAGLRGVIDRLKVSSANGRPVSNGAAVTDGLVVTDGLSVDDGFAVAVITLDPVRDTPGRLATLARSYGIQGEGRKFLSGPPAEVESALDDLGFARRRDPATGVIDHAPLYILIDREGRIAYRFTTGETQERWMTEAVSLLQAETSSGLRAP